MSIAKAATDPPIPEPSEPPPRRGRAGLLVAGAVVLLAATAAWIAYRGIIVKPDSSSYLRSAVHRTAGYPMLLELCRVFPGRPGRLWGAIVLQSALGMAAATWLAYELRRRFRLGVPSSLTTLTALLSPFWTLNLGNLVLSQALAYGFFLLAARSLVRAALDGRLRDFVLYFTWAGAAALTRPQFVFLHFVSALVLLEVFVRRRAPRRPLLLAALFAACLIVPGLVDQTWRWHKHGLFESVPYAGQQLIAGSLYVARPGDEELFSGPDRDLFEEMYRRADRDRLLAPVKGHEDAWLLLPFLRLPLYDMRHFGFVYNRLAWDTGFGVAREKLCPKCGFAATFSAVDAPLRRISLALAAAHPGDRLRLYLSTLLAAGRPYSWFLLLLALAAGYELGIRRREPVGVAFVLALLLHACNLGLTAVVEPELERYTFPTTVLYAALWVVLLRDLIVHRRVSGPA
jgi:hypothetical protein